MSDEIKQKALASAAACLEGKSPGEKAAVIHQHLGRREMTDIIIETMKSSPGTPSETLHWPVTRGPCPVHVIPAAGFYLTACVFSMRSQSPIL